MILKAVVGFAGVYEVSDSGEVYSINYRRSGMRKRLAEIGLKGYKRVALSKNGNSRQYLVHRLVAIAFLGIDIQKPFVNHKNGIKSDNRLENLEWCTFSENLQHSYDFLGRISGMKGKLGRLNKNSRRIIQYGMAGEKVAEYDSIADACRILNLRDANICASAKGKRKSSGGYIWRYAL